MLGPWNTLDCSVSDLIKRASVNSTRPGRRSNKLGTITIASVSFGENPIIGCGRVIHENQTELMKDNTTDQVVPSSIVFIKQPLESVSIIFSHFRDHSNVHWSSECRGLLSTSATRISLSKSHTQFTFLVRNARKALAEKRRNNLEVLFSYFKLKCFFFCPVSDCCSFSRLLNSKLFGACGNELRRSEIDLSSGLSEHSCPERNATVINWFAAADSSKVNWNAETNVAKRKWWR